LSGTTFGGKIYIDGSNIFQKRDGVDTDAKGFGFDIKRFYFSVTHKFDDTWSVNLTTDFKYDSNDGKSNLFVKRAFAQGNFYPLFKLRAGSAEMPGFRTSSICTASAMSKKPFLIVSIWPTRLMSACTLSASRASSTIKPRS